MHAIIMAGGSGTRFWPASRRRRPKQLLPLVQGKTLLQATVDRAAAVAGGERTWIVTNAELARALPAALPAFPAAQVLVEPEPRDTAPCIAFATAWIEARDPGATMAFLPADHVIGDSGAFAEVLRRAAALAADGASLVTLGIRPTHAATGYGYIERGDAVDGAAPRAFRALSFREKPDRATATDLVASGRFSWNSGVFVWTAAALLAAMAGGYAELAECTRAMCAAAARGAPGEVAAAFRRAPRTSIDYAVMERATRVVVVETDVAWSDLGSFPALTAVAPRDDAGNVAAVGGGARTLLEDASDCVVYAEGPRAVALLGTHGLVVVAVDDAVLVCPRERADDIKRLVQRARERGLEDLL